MSSTGIRATLLIFAFTALALAPSTSATHAPSATCERLLYGPDIDSGICYDLNGDDCLVWMYNAYGNDVCYVPNASPAFGEICRQVLYGPDIDQGICVRPGASSCRIQWYSHYGTGPNYCVA